MNETRTLIPRAVVCVALTLLAVATVIVLVANMERHSSATAATLGAAIASTAAAVGPWSCIPRRWQRAPRR